MSLCRVRLNTISQFVDHLTEQVERAIRIATVDEPGQTVEAAAAPTATERILPTTGFDSFSV